MKPNHKIQKIILKLDSLYPDRDNKKKELIDILIATKLSQNTTDKAAAIAFNNLKQKFSDWQSIAKAPISEIAKQIRVCGLANNKSKEIKNFLQTLIKKRGKISLEYLNNLSNEKIYEELLQFKGFGVKTISCLIAFGLNRPVFPVDTHIHRILNRLGIVATKTAEQTFQQAKALIPDKYKVELHRKLILFGREICTAKNPKCNECKLYAMCIYEHKNTYAIKNTKLRFSPRKDNYLILDYVG
ncbi:MAG: endonuclease III domain-containing protein [Ignavibacteria bacterium]